MVARGQGNPEGQLRLGSRTNERARLGEVVLLADLDAIVPEDGVSGGDVKMNVRQQVIHEIRQALHAFRAAARLPGHGLVFAGK